MAAIGEVVINFRPRGVEAAARQFNRAIEREIIRSHTPPRPMPKQPPIRERILALYRQQGRPQAHLDRVMRLGRELPEEVRKQWERRFRESLWQQYGSNGPPPPCRPPPPANPPRKPA